MGNCASSGVLTRIASSARARPSDRREFVREGKEGGEEPRRGEGNPGASAGALASNPLPWWENLTMDVSLRVRLRQPKRRERVAGHRA